MQIKGQAPFSSLSPVLVALDQEPLQYDPPGLHQNVSSEAQGRQCLKNCSGIRTGLIHKFIPNISTFHRTSTTWIPWLCNSCFISMVRTLWFPLNHSDDLWLCPIEVLNEEEFCAAFWITSWTNRSKPWYVCSTVLLYTSSALWSHGRNLPFSAKIQDKPGNRKSIALDLEVHANVNFICPCTQ